MSDTTEGHYQDIRRTDRVCNFCGSQIGVIHGILSDTFYCRNINCYSVPYSEITKKGLEFIS